MTDDEALYVYGVVRKHRLPERLRRRGIRLVGSGRLAALVAPFDGDAVRATRRNLLEHAEIVEDVFDRETVLPMRFGVVVAGERTVREALLDPNADLLERLLAENESRVELSLKASYDEDAALAELVAADTRLARMRERYRAEPTMDRGVALGEAVAEGLGARRDRDAARIVGALESLAHDVRAGEVSLEGGVVNLAFLLDRDRVPEFEERVEDLANELSPPVRFKLVGPLPPYSFVDVPLAVTA